MELRVRIQRRHPDLRDVFSAMRGTTGEGPPNAEDAMADVAGKLAELVAL
jgi:hypothetical protein